MSLVAKRWVIPCCFLLATGSALAQDLYVYPAKGQSRDQQNKDEYDCYQWARNDTGFDPMQTPKATSPAPTSQRQSGGLVRGGIGGAIIGGIADGSSGAKTGAAIGGLLGGARQHQRNTRAEQERAQWEQQQASQYANNRNRYNRAYSACMEGRGYTVR